jgi:hypothetical protein
VTTLPSGLSDRVTDGEDLARFLTSSNHFNQVAVKPVAFLPRIDTGETSVARHGASPNALLRQLGELYIGGSRSLHGAAIVLTRDVRAAGLDVEPHEPPPQHANINRWAGDSDEATQRARRKEQAILLAQRATLVRF